MLKLKSRPPKIPRPERVRNWRRFDNCKPCGSFNCLSRKVVRPSALNLFGDGIRNNNLPSFYV